MPSIQLLLVDDHAMFRAGLRMVLTSNIPDAAVIEAGSMSEALQQTSSPPDLILLDIKLPGLNGMEGIALFKRQWPDVPVLMLSAMDEPQMVRQATARGASGFVSKVQGAEDIIEVVNQLLRDGSPLPPPEAAEEHVSIRLTPRQCEVLELLCEGLSNKLIARRLELSENTVRWHVQAVLSELQVSSRSEAAFAARQLGLVS
mgnify:CR=1 FL=1